MCEPATGTETTSGEAFLQSRLAQLECRVANGEACEVVFDLDNTLFDTRARTLRVAEAFDRAHGTRLFESLQLEQVGLDARDTSERIGGLPPEFEEAFVAYWETAFWHDAAFAHDTPVEPVLAWARRADGAGAAVRFLTGRVEALRAATTRQLANVGFEVTGASLWMKPDLSSWTLAFKEARLRQTMQRSWLGWYATEGRNEIAYLQGALPGGPWVLVDCSLQSKGPAVHPDTPTLARVF